MPKHPFALALEQWYAEHGRDLPWRQTRDPYRIWISEIILQQTRVVQGLEYYNRFIERFPTVEALALAPLDEVMRHWEGLGYYSRARNLHTAAKQIMESGGPFPCEYKSVLALKGVGEYTAAAICSFAFGLPHAVVDGNVYRVLSRYFGMSDAIDTTAGKRKFFQLANELLDHSAPALYNQAIMDFGALQCLPRSPLCRECPLHDGCVAYAEGKTECYPVKSKRTSIKDRFLTYFVLIDGSQTYIRRRPEGDIWAGLYEPMLIETDAPTDVAALVPQGFNIIATAGGITHQLTHRTIRAQAALIVKGEAAGDGLSTDGYTKVSIAELQNYAASRLVNIIYEQLLCKIEKA